MATIGQCGSGLICKQSPEPELPQNRTCACVLGCLAHLRATEFAGGDQVPDFFKISKRSRACGAIDLRVNLPDVEFNTPDFSDPLRAHATSVL